MATEDGTRSAVEDLLEKEIRRISFFQLVRLLLQERPGSVPPGRGGPPTREAVRFRANASLAFARSDVECVEREPDSSGTFESRFLVTVNFLGLYGPASPMPNHFTESILWAGPADPARAFLDLFHHRLISFVYRAWEKYRHPVQHAASAADETTARFLSLIGLGTRGAPERAGLPPASLLSTAGQLGSRPRSAAGLEGLLTAHFPGMRFRVEPCRERHVRIPAESRCRLGTPSARLGTDACLGDEVRDRAGAFRTRVGPLSTDQYRSLLPGSTGLERLALLTRLYVRSPLEFDVELELLAPEVPPLRLAPSEGLHLGWMSWLAPANTETGRAHFGPGGADPLAIPGPTLPTSFVPTGRA